MENKKMILINVPSNKRFRSIITTIWGMLLCFNLMVCLLIKNPHPFNWIMVGFALGFLLRGLMESPLMTSFEKLLNLQSNLIDRMCKMLDINKTKSKSPKTKVKK